jgi:glyoxylase-like metal-dependent hydrolase (beta-lactamase superfamily II)
LVFGSAMQSSVLSYPFSEKPVGIGLLEVAPGVRWLRLRLPWRLDHINLWLLDDAEGLAVVDTGLGDPATREVWVGLIATLDRPITRIIVTHYHPDHLGNADWLAQTTGASIWMAFGEFLLAHAVHSQASGYDTGSMLAHFRSHGLDEARLARIEARGNVYRHGVPSLPMRFGRLADGDRLQIGGCDWQAIAGQGHSPEHMALYSAQAGVLISGDMLLPRITTNISVPAAMPEEDAVERFLDSLGRFESLPEATLVLPSHGQPFRGLHARIGQLRAHHAERDATILRMLGCSHTAADLLPDLFQRELDSHQLMFALGEAVAHLNHLWRKEGLLRIQDDDGRLRYQARP